MLVASIDELTACLRQALAHFEKTVTAPICADCSKGQQVLPTQLRFRTPDGKTIAYQVDKYEVFGADWCSITETPDLRDAQNQVVTQDVPQPDGTVAKIPVKGAQVTKFFCPTCSQKRGLKTAEQQLKQQEGS